MADESDPNYWRKSAMSVASNATLLKRWRSFVRTFSNFEDGEDNRGRPGGEHDVEKRRESGVPDVPRIDLGDRSNEEASSERTRKLSQTGHEGWPRALSTVRKASSPKKLAPNDAESSTDGFRITYGVSAGDSRAASRTRHSISGDSQRRSSDDARDAAEGDDNEHDEHEETRGLATKRASTRYSAASPRSPLSPFPPMSPMSPAFKWGFPADRKTEDRVSKSILKRESIRLSALPPMPKKGDPNFSGRGSKRKFPAGHGMAVLTSDLRQKTELDRGFSFPESRGMESNARKFVGWNGTLDPARPENRPLPVKLVLSFLLLAITLTMTFVSGTLTPTSGRISRDLGSSTEVVILASTLTVLGFALGAPFFGALSERYGRKHPLLLGLVVFAILNVPTALTKDLATLLAFRFFAGVFGAAPLTIAPAALADLWGPIGRGNALAFFGAATVTGPVAGAVASSYLADVEYPGWRWTAWIAVGLCALFGLPLTLIYRETSAQVLLRRKAQRLRLVTRDWSFHTEAEEEGAGYRAQVIKAVILLAEPTLLLPTIHMSFACGVLNLMFVSYGHAFRTDRHWFGGSQDLPILPIIFGCFVGIFINFIISKKKVTTSTSPEARLVPWIIGAWILPIGLLVFAWTSSPEIIFVPQLMAGVPSGIGISLIIIGGLNYIFDTYIAMPSLAVGANTLIRFALAFSFPLFAPQMYDVLDINWANTVLAIIAVILVPIPILLMKLGPLLRRKGRFAVKPGSEVRQDGDSEMIQKSETFSVVVEEGRGRPGFPFP